MQLVTIVQKINGKLAGEMLTYDMLKDYLDEVIDDINAKLNSNYPVFSDFNSTDYPTQYPDYNFFPDRFIRSVVVLGAAYKYFIMDEEGIQTAQQYGWDYKDNLFRMERDYSDQVPEIYQADYNGSVEFDTEDETDQTPFYFPIFY